MRKITYFILLLIIGTIAGYGGILIVRNMRKSNRQTNQNKTLKIVCTTSMITDAVSILGGSHVQIKGLMGPGVDPHLYRAREGDMHALAQANIIFYNGLHLEGKMADIFQKMPHQTKTVAVADAIPQEKLHASEFQNLFDPHIWFDLTLWKLAINLIAQTLIACDPEHQGDYQENLNRYALQLAELEQYIRFELKKIPQERRILVTAHDAFGYFGRAYGFQVVGLQGLSTDSEAGTQDIQNLAAFIVKNRVPAIFVESSIPQRSLIAVQNATRAAGWNVAIGQELYSDALGSPQDPAGSYLGMMRHNVDALVNALS